MAIRSESWPPVTRAVRQLHRMLSVDIDSPQVFLSIAIGKKDNVAAIGRNGWLLVESRVSSELFRTASVEIGNPEILFSSNCRRIHKPALRSPREAVQSIVAGRGELFGMIQIVGGR